MPANPHEGLPDDWRYCYHAHRQCVGCKSDLYQGAQMVERKVKYWKDAEHWHISCALEEALRKIENHQKEEPRLIRYKWTPKEPAR